MSVMPGYKNYNTLCVCLWETLQSIGCYGCYDVRCNFRMRENKKDVMQSPFLYYKSDHFQGLKSQAFLSDNL